jgi:isoleucyl-tRNA synthetase
MPELERYMLHLTAELDAKLKRAVADFDFNAYVRGLTDFCNNDLSAFFFDIRKDSLYCDAPTNLKRRAYRTVLDTMFHALVRWAAPVLVFTAEEVWGTRFPDAASVHLLEWPEIGDVEDRRLGEVWSSYRALREEVTGHIEPMRRAKEIGSSLETRVALGFADDADRPMLGSDDLAELFIVSEVLIDTGHVVHGPAVATQKVTYSKCGRCWRHLPEGVDDGGLCARCEAVVGE